jgi:hypothetical protein
MKIIKPSTDRVVFECEDGRQMFEVRSGKDGRSIEVRAIEPCLVNKILYSNALTVEPIVSNSIIVRTTVY